MGLTQSAFKSTSVWLVNVFTLVNLPILVYLSITVLFLFQLRLLQQHQGQRLSFEANLVKNEYVWLCFIIRLLTCVRHTQPICCSLHRSYPAVNNKWSFGWKQSEHSTHTVEDITGLNMYVPKYAFNVTTLSFSDMRICIFDKKVMHHGHSY